MDWGLSGPYTSAIQISSRLWASHNTSRCAVTNTDVTTGKKSCDSVSKAFESKNTGIKKAKSSLVLANVLSGDLLSHIHVPSHAHHQVGADEGDVFGSSNHGDQSSKALASDVTSISNKILRGSDSHSTVINNEITKYGIVAEHHTTNINYGRKIVQASIATDATGVGVVGSTEQQDSKNGKLDNSKEPHKPFFYLPSEDEDSSHDDHLLKDPDLYPVPKTEPETPLTISPLSPSSKNNTHPPILPRSPQKQQSDKTTDEIQDRIRHCLQRARSRSSSLCGLGSFEAGLYRLEGLLDGKRANLGNIGDDDVHESHSSIEHNLRSTGHEIASMPKYRDTGTITGQCIL